MTSLTLIAMDVASSSAAAQTSSFPDGPDGEYYTQAVANLQDMRVFEGSLCTAGFGPDRAIDRKTMAVWVVRVLPPRVIAQSDLSNLEIRVHYCASKKAP